jgi:hypothetical protein
MIQRNANLTQNNLHKIKLPEELYGHLLSSVVRHPPQLEKEPTCENSFIFIFTILQKNMVSKMFCKYIPLLSLHSPVDHYSTTNRQMNRRSAVAPTTVSNGNSSPSHLKKRNYYM